VTPRQLDGNMVKILTMCVVNSMLKNYNDLWENKGISIEFTKVIAAIIGLVVLTVVVLFFTDVGMGRGYEGTRWRGDRELACLEYRDRECCPRPDRDMCNSTEVWPNFEDIDDEEYRERIEELDQEDMRILCC